MKNLQAFPKILLLLLFACSLATGVRAQSPGRNFHSNVRLNEINPQAFRHFKKNYSAISNEYWYKSNTGFVVKFMDNQISNQVFYDQRGEFIYGIKYYEEENLEKDIRNRIHKEFPEYVIDVVSEITSNENVVYLLSLKNKLDFKNIMITDTEMKVINNDINYATR
jgi:hypothetical protein